MDYQQAKKLAIDLRKKMTPAEKTFWDKVRNRKFNNWKFNRQYPISYKLLDNTLNWFIVDFHCFELLH